MPVEKTLAPANVRDRAKSAAPDVGGASQRGIRRSTVIRRLAVALVIACAILFFFPALVAPVAADDRWYAWLGAVPDWSIGYELRTTWGDFWYRVSTGRVNAITGLERRLAAKLVTEPAVATSTPVVFYLALLKAAFLAGGLFTGIAFLRSLRWRTSDGRLVRAGRRTVMLFGVASLAGTAVGVQNQAPFLNGWTAYPVSTYTAAISIFGSVALLLWLTRLVAERSTTRMTAVAVVTLVLLALVTNFRYELVMPAVPVAAVALAIVPVTDRSQQAAGRRAKLITGAAYFGTFIPVFLATRYVLRSVCAQNECYEGVKLALSPAIVRTAFYNLVSSVPGAGGSELLRGLERVGWEDRYPALPTAWSVAAGILVALALIAVRLTWRSVPSPRPSANSRGAHPKNAVTPAQATQSNRAEAILLGVGVVLSLLVALGTATVMGVSERSQTIIDSPGTPYRNVVVTWTALVFCAVLTVLGMGLVLKRWIGTVAWMTLAVTIGLVGAMTLPGNLLAMRADRVANAPIEAIHWEIVQGDTAPGSDEWRCALFERARGALPERPLTKLYQKANTAYLVYHGQPFCSDPQYDPDVASRP